MIIYFLIILYLYLKYLILLITIMLDLNIFNLLIDILNNKFELK